MPILQCQGLTKYYGGVLALDHADIAIEPGQIVGLLGPNGSGKTTLIKLANGLLQPTSGSILIDDMTPSPKTHAIVSYLPERIALTDWMNVRQLMDFYGDFYADFQREAAEQMLAQLQLPLGQTVRQMSKGTREKLQLILTMSRKAKLYLLDEPIGGVDPATRDYILHSTLSHNNPEAAVAISTLLITDVESILDSVIFLNQGKVVLQSTVDDIRETRGKSVDAYFREVFRCWEN